MLRQIAQSYAEELHRMQWELFPEGKDSPARVIQITASRFAEGVTTTTLALAASIAGAHGDEGVLVVEGNLRDPSFHGMLNVGSSGSLHRVLEGQGEIWSNIERVEAYGISVLPAGQPLGSGTQEALESSLENLGPALDKLRGRYRYILIDTPPVLPFRDSNVIARVTDGVILVVEANVTRAQVVDVAIKRLESAEARILGLVLNKREFHIPAWLYRYI